MSNFKNLKSLTILIVEDDELTIDILVGILEKFFKKVYFACNGVEGVEKFKENSIDIVLTDINMPKLNGLEMSREIKKLKPDSKVVIASAYFEQDILLSAINIGIDKFLTKPIKNENLFGVLSEVAEIVLKNRIIQTKNQYISILFNSQPDIVVLTDGEKLISANRAFFEFFKEFKNREEFLEKYDCICDTFEEIDQRGFIYSSKDRDNWIEYILSTPKEVHKAGIKKDGRVHIFVLSVKSVKTIDDKLEYVVNFTDISKMEEYKSFLEKKVKDEIDKNRQKDQIMSHQSRLAQMGEMINMIAHQWRQPLNVITSATIDIQFANELGSLNEDTLKRGLSNIETQAKKMSSTIDDFMNFFKPTKEKSEFELFKLLTDIYSLISAQFIHREIEFKIEIEKNLKFKGYKNELEQVLLNIITNARDAFDNKSISNKYIKIKAKELTQGEIVISIIDNAGGVSDEIKDKIFNPYFTTKDEGKGTGIGLYMSNNIIQRSFKGHIQVDNVVNSENQTGAKFKIFIKE